MNRSELGAVWLVQSRKFVARLEFWLVLVGYDLRKHAFSSRLYVVYVIVFFSIWGFAVLTLLAGFAGQILNALPFGSALSAAVAVGGAAFILLFLLELYFASRRSPFVFSEADANLLCLTPVDRRYVALIWLLGAWLVRSLFVWPAAVVLAYGLLDAQSTGDLVIADLPIYLLSGLRMLLIAIPLMTAALSLAWTAGAWRLQGKRDLPALRWAAPGLVVIFIMGWVLTSSAGGMGIPTWLWPLIYPLEAGLGGASLLAGIGIGLVWAALGLLVLWSASPGMSLARAAQETRNQEKLQAALLTGTFDLAGEIRQRERLGAGRKPTRLPAGQGLAALVWRNAVQVRRSFSLGQLFSWLAILVLSLAILLIQDWGARAWAFIFWFMLVGQQVGRPLKMDLQRWWLMRQLPFSAQQLIIGDMLLPTIGTLCAILAAFLIALILGQPIPVILVWFSLPAVAGVGLSVSVDILRKSRSDLLLAGRVPDLSLLAVGLTALVLLPPTWLSWLAVYRWSIAAWLVLPVMLAVIVAEEFALFRLASSLLRNIR